jgi:cytochrome c-type biogenesis protein CcmH/NrfG
VKWWRKKASSAPPSEKEYAHQVLVSALMVVEAQFRTRVHRRLEAGRMEADVEEQGQEAGLKEQWAKLLEEGRSILAENPIRADNQVSVGTCLQSLGRYEEAESAYAEALRLDPEAKEVRVFLESAREARQWASAAKPSER